MDEIIGWLALFLILVLILLKTKNPNILKLLLFGFFLRASLVILDRYFISVPGGNFDAIGFEQQARNFSDEFGFGILFHMFQDDNYLISRIISIFYTLTTHSEMMGKTISVALGTVSIFLFYHLTLMVWENKNIALRASWVFALMPSLCLFSSLILREVYVTFFLIITLFPIIILIKKIVNKKTQCIIWGNFSLNKHFFHLLFIICGFYILKHLHGGMFLGVFVLLMFFFYYLILEEFQFIKTRKKFRIKSILIISLIMLPVFLWYTQVIVVPYVPDLSEIPKLYEIIQRRFEVSVINVVNGDYGSNFPTFLVPNNIIDFFPKIFLRVIYFLYSPFPWDIIRFSHMIGLVNSFLIIFLSFCCWMNKEKIFEKAEIKFLFLLLFAYIIIYSIGTGNFGTSIRHQTKFMFILICLSAPKLPNISFSKNN